MAETTHTMEFTRFGDVTFDESEVLTFPWGLPGFEDLRRFIVLSLPDHGAYIWLQSLDVPSVALPIIDPWQIFSDYDPKPPKAVFESLAISSPDEFCTMCVVVVGAEAAEMTMNLFAPIIINVRTRTGRQVPLDGSPYGVRVPIPRIEPAAAGEVVAS